jgi:hypothetical protein
MTVEIFEMPIHDHLYIHMWWKLLPEEILSARVGWFTWEQVKWTSHFGHHLTGHVMNYFWEINCQVCLHFIHTSQFILYVCGSIYSFQIFGQVIWDHTSCHCGRQSLTQPVTLFWAIAQNLHCFLIFLHWQSTYTVSTRPFATAAQSLLLCAEKCMDSQGGIFEQLLWFCFVYLLAWLLISVLKLIFFNTSPVYISVSLKLQMGYVWLF